MYIYFFTSAVVNFNRSPVFPWVPGILLLSFSIYDTKVVKSLCNNIDTAKTHKINTWEAWCCPLTKRYGFVLSCVKVPPTTLDVVTRN